MLSRLLRHTSVYGIGSALLTVAGFISFPILTRLLSVSDYGLLSLVGTTVALLVAVGKLGIQQSIVRFHAELYSTERRASEAQLLATVLWGMGLTSAVTAVIWIVAVSWAPHGWWHDSRLPHLMRLTAALIIVRVLDSAFLNVLRAQQRSTAYTAYTVVRRYAVLGLALTTMLYVVPGLDGFFGSAVIGEAIAVYVLAQIVLRRPSSGERSALGFANFSSDLLRLMLAFGIPLMAYEIAGTVLNVGDRYVVQALLGSGAQGVYSAAYSLCEYVQAILINAMVQALIPIYTRLWVEDGATEARRFIDRVFHFYLLVAAPIIGGLALVGNEVIVELASSRYSSAAAVIPLIMAGLVCEGAIPIVGAGLFIHKRTRLVVPVVGFCALFNIAASALLVPRFGLSGAAMAMLASYVILVTGFAIGGRAHLRIEIPWLHAGKCAAMSLLMYLGTVRIEIANLHARLAAQVCVGAAIYGLLALLLDRRAREIALDARQRLTRRLAAQ
jgi:O-antigen/teichoic acid export membrane protein